MVLRVQSGIVKTSAAASGNINVQSGVVKASIGSGVLASSRVQQSVVKFAVKVFYPSAGILSPRNFPVFRTTQARQAYIKQDAP